MKYVVDISRLVIGFVFIFSGFVKAVDPSGTAIKFEEYFLAFGMNFMTAAAMPLAILLSAAEMLIGLNLLTKTFLRFTTWLLMCFMVYFTLLTFILAITNPVSDCGCFGDAIKLTNWETFWKNIVLMVPALTLFFNRNQINSKTNIFRQWLLMAFNFLVPIITSLYCILHEPIIDFRPYTVGTHIADKMVIPEGAQPDVFESILVYEKDGVSKEFNSDSFPWQDTTWKWVETKQKLISKGYEPPIHDFLIINSENLDITEKLLSDSNYVFLIIAPKLEKACKKGIEKLNNFAMKVNNLGYPVYCLTSSTNEEIEKFRNAILPVFEICMADETTLKTIQRSNPGLLILREGTILGKYNYRDIPPENEIKPDVLSIILEKQHDNHEKLVIFLIFFSILYLYSLILLIVPGNNQSK
jgi:uncharacterized membrane protein YphA (DoxX/SURF4 family)